MKSLGNPWRMVKLSKRPARQRISPAPGVPIQTEPSASPSKAQAYS